MKVQNLRGPSKIHLEFPSYHPDLVRPIKQSPKMPPTRIHLVRHGQGQHNVEPLEKNRQIHDAQLTDLGIQRCQKFNQAFPKEVHIDLVCASPMWRTIQTASYCFHDVIAKSRTKKILLLPDAQEITAIPCDIGSPVSVITKGFGDLVDASLVSDDWASKKGRYGVDTPAIMARAKALRQWLKARPEEEIVVVSHGAILDYVVGDNLDENGCFIGKLLGTLV